MTDDAFTTPGRIVSQPSGDKSMRGTVRKKREGRRLDDIWAKEK